MNALCDSKNFQTSLLFLKAHFAKKIMNYNETHYCFYIQKKIFHIKMCNVQKKVFVRHKRVRKIQHECYFMKLTHEIFSMQHFVNVCLIAQFNNFRLNAS